MDVNDNFDQAMQHLNSAFVLACGGHYEPKSTRDFILSCHLKHMLDTIHSPAFDRLVQEEERRIKAHDWVRSMIQP